MTNSLRAKRGLIQSGECPLGCHCEERIIHTLRDCTRAKQVWREIINPNKHSVFFSLDLQEWLRWNTMHNPGAGKFTNWTWTKVFGMMCWLIWKHRCQQAMEEVITSPSEIKHQCLFHLTETDVGGRVQHLIFGEGQYRDSRWIPPPTGVMRIEVDASVHHGQQAACGGVIRDDRGQWIMGFKRNLGWLPITIAEMWAIRTGLEVGRYLQLPKVQLLSDSIEAINVLFRDGTLSHPYRTEIEDTRRLIWEHNSLEISHIDREQLICADTIAREAHFVGSQVVLYPQVLPSCSAQVLLDQRMIPSWDLVSM